MGVCSVCESLLLHVTHHSYPSRSGASLQCGAAPTCGFVRMLHTLHVCVEKIELRHATLHVVVRCSQGQTTIDGTKGHPAKFFLIFWCGSFLYNKNWQFQKTTSKIKMAQKRMMFPKINMTPKMRGFILPGSFQRGLPKVPRSMFHFVSWSVSQSVSQSVREGFKKKKIKNSGIFH